MHDAENFLAAIRAAPEDDTPRLLFADWLEERGDPRGEFIRMQCELARLPEDNPGRPEWPVWKSREHRLRTKHEPAWTASLRGLAKDREFRRGFVEIVTMEAPVFCRQAAELFEAAPGITHIRFLEAAGVMNDLAAVPELGRLKALQLAANYLESESLATLAHSPYLGQLTLLHLGRNNLTDASMQALANSGSLSHLESLNLSYNFITGDGAAILASADGLSHLVHVDLSYNYLSIAAEPILRRRFGENVRLFGQAHESQIDRLTEWIARRQERGR